MTKIDNRLIFPKEVRYLLNLSFKKKRIMLETIFKPSTELFNSEETCNGFIKFWALVKGKAKIKGSGLPQK